MNSKGLAAIVNDYGQKYSEILDISLSSRKDEEIFKWFLASILFGAPITEASAVKTHKRFRKYSVLTPERILETGWDGLVRILDEGSYTRYDFKTADKLLEAMRNLTSQYRRSLNLMHKEASDSSDLEKRLKDLGKGIGDATASIFLRELGGIWQKANPNPTSLVLLAGRELGILKEEATAEKALADLKNFWSKNKIKDKSFVDFETALVRIGKESRKKKGR